MNLLLTRRLFNRLAFSAPIALFASKVRADASQLHEELESELVPNYLPKGLRTKLKKAGEWFRTNGDLYWWDPRIPGGLPIQQVMKTRAVLADAAHRRQLYQAADAILSVRHLGLKPAREVRKAFLDGTYQIVRATLPRYSTAFSKKGFERTWEFQEWRQVQPPPYATKAIKDALIAEPQFERVTEKWTIFQKPYASVEMTAADLALLQRFENPHELKLRRVLLLGESYLAEHDFESAVKTIRQVTSDYEANVRVEDKQIASLNSLYRLAQCRVPNALVAWGDTLFRSTRNPTTDERRRIAEKYQAALSDLDRALLPEGSTLAMFANLLAAYARHQLECLTSRRNFFGLSDDAVPILSYERLHQKVAISLDQAANALQQSKDFLLKADAIRNKAEELEMTSRLREIERQRMDLLEKNAENNVKLAKARIKMSEDQWRAMQVKSGWSLFRQGVTSAVGAAADNPIVAAQFDPFGAALDYAANRRQHKHQMKILGLQRDGAERDLELARLAKRASERESEYFERVLERHRNQHHEYYLELANFFRRRARTVCKEANVNLYLYERAIADRFVLPDLALVRMDYDIASIEARGTEDDFGHADMTNAFADLQQRTEFRDEDGYRKSTQFNLDFQLHFPVELETLKTTGATTFQLSQFAFDRRGAGRYGVRVGAYAVHFYDQQGRPLAAREKPYGDLTHSGLFVDRDRELTLQADKSDIERRLKSASPSDDGADGALDYSALGLVYRTIKPLHIELSPDTEVLTELEHRLGAERTQVPPFSIYSPLGLWKLQLRGGLHERLGNVVITFRLKYFEEREVTETVASLLGMFIPYYENMAKHAMEASR